MMLYLIKTINKFSSYNQFQENIPLKLMMYIFQRMNCPNYFSIAQQKETYVSFILKGCYVSFPSHLIHLLFHGREAPTHSYHISMYW